jgi:lipopolysaccharide export system permease protein
LKKIDSFVLKSYLGPFILTFFIAVFILLMQFVWKYVDDLVGKGLEWAIILKLLGLVALTTISLALPLAILFSSLMAFGNLGEFMELTAMKASGISLQRAMRPVFFFCMLMACFAFYFSNNILPVANLKMKTLLSDITQKRPELNIKPGIFNNDIDNYVIRIGNKSDDGKILEDIMIYDHSRTGKNQRLVVASKGVMSQTPDKRFLELKLTDGYSYTEAEQGRKNSRFRYPFIREHFKEDLIRFDLTIFELNKSDERLFKKNYQMLNLSQLEAETDTLITELARDRSMMPELLFRGPFFEAGKTYSTQYAQHPRKNTTKPTAIKDTGNVDTSANSLERRIVRMKGLNRNIDSLDTVAFKSKIPDPEILNTANVGLVPLKNKTEVLKNFSTAQQYQIFEKAASLLRSSKSSLDFSIQSFDMEEERIYKHQIEWHRKFTLSFACIVLFLIGAPLGAIVKKGGLGMPVVFSLIFFVAYHMISITGEKLAREAVASPFQGMWLSSAVLLPIGLFLSFKATRDSALFDADAYKKLFRKVFRRSAS